MNAVTVNVPVDLFVVSEQNKNKGHFEGFQEKIYVCKKPRIQFYFSPLICLFFFKNSASVAV